MIVKRKSSASETKRITKKPATKRRKRSLRVTEAERRLLLYPPTTTTWACDKCKIPNVGSVGNCWVCKAPKTKDSKLLWESYVAACAKVGVEVGYTWKLHNDIKPVMKKHKHPKEKWQDAPELNPVETKESSG